jgi:cystathionine beta-lyase/cystathionine gamma-synthase
MGDFCTAERFHQALQVINLATEYYDINESVIESPALENRPLEDIKSIMIHRLENSLRRIKVGEECANVIIEDLKRALERA